MPLDVDLNVEIDRQLPDAESDSTTKPLRGGRYGEAYTLNVMPTHHLLADEGTYQVATSPTPGTAIAFAVNASVSETAGNFIYLKNNESQGNSRAKRIYLNYIRLLAGTVPAAAVAAHFFIKVDNKDRYTSGGTTIIPVNANIDSGTGTVSQLYAGALTTTAPSPSARLLARGILRSAIPVANDEFVLSCGFVEAPGSIQLGGLVAQRMSVPIPPVVLGPQDNMCLQLWFPSNAVTAPQFEVEMGWFER